MVVDYSVSKKMKYINVKIICLRKISLLISAQLTGRGLRPGSDLGLLEL